MMPYSLGPLGLEPRREHSVGAGTWEREARWVKLLASELDVAVDAQALLYCDVRDLMALRRGLQAALRDGCTLPRHCDRAGVLAPSATHAAGPMAGFMALLAGVLRKIIRRHR